VFDIELQSPRSREGIKEAATSSPSFSRFIMLLINDTTFLLDEGAQCWPAAFLVARSLY
jgi:hypothetical protein